MSREGFHVRIHQNPVTGGLELYFVERRNGRLSVAQPVQLTMEEVPEGSIDVKPTIQLPGIAGDEFLNSMAEELDAKHIKTDKDAKIEGVLEATRYHLEDMRALLKLNKGGT